MLQFLARLKLVLPGSHFRLLTDSMTTAKGRQRWIRECHPAGHEFFMDPDEIPLAIGQLLQDLLPVGFGFLGTDQWRHIRGLRP